MSKHLLSMLAAGGLAALLAGCGGQGRDDTLVDGAVDRTNEGDTAASAEDVGPPSMSAAAAGPATGRTSGEPVAGAGPGPAPGAAAGPMLSLATQGAHGPHLAAGGAGPVYVLEGDRDGAKCTGECLAAWPPVLMGDTQPSGGAGLQGAMIATIVRPDRSRQVTYNGQPLYRYAGDAGAGGAQGHGVTDRWGTWRLVSPAGTPITAKPTGG